MFNLQTKLKLNRWLGRVTGPPRDVSFAGNNSQPKKLLFLFPVEDQWFEQSIRVIRYLEKFPSKNIEFAILDSQKDKLATPSHKCIYFHMSEEKPTQIDAERLINEIGDKSFDAVINLAPSVDFEMAMVISKINAPKRIGLRSPGSDELYNIQIQTSSESDHSAAYEQILSLCDLGPADPHPDYGVWR